ncbi:hypothetical protein CDAR_243711 [Caerostris darwini]|uniref:Uncharacterized protein n=1 Tax=Caerostris darwini TaxID=1538125 RepID=A0AAV4VCV9_9ARAC|nr:hypothetical protein CDAR_243711 [Caerostris darwini]
MCEQMTSNLSALSSSFEYPLEENIFIFTFLILLLLSKGERDCMRFASTRYLTDNILEKRCLQREIFLFTMKNELEMFDIIIVYKTRDLPLKEIIIRSLACLENRRVFNSSSSVSQ